VEVGLTQGDLALVTRGVEEGERVVVDGQNQLKPGSRVVAREQGKPSGGAKVAGDGADAARSGGGGAAR
jgi:multidrug efflux system membrane fusion protein